MVSGEGEQLRRRYFAETTGTQRTQSTRRKTRSSAAAPRRVLTQDDIVRGYEWKKGKFVVIEDDEL